MQPTQIATAAGIKDAVVDDATGIAEDYGGPAPGSYGARLRAGIEAHLTCLSDPNCDLAGLITSKDWAMWNPACPNDKEAGVINWFLASGTAAAALAPPGQLFHYSDTGYVILGLLTEMLSGQSLHRQWRERIFDPLGMDRSYLAYANQRLGFAGRVPIGAGGRGCVPAARGSGCRL